MTTYVIDIIRNALFLYRDSGALSQSQVKKIIDFIYGELKDGGKNK